MATEQQKRAESLAILRNLSDGKPASANSACAKALIAAGYVTCGDGRKLALTDKGRTAVADAFDCGGV
jgi:hypothetical protein